MQMSVLRTRNLFNIKLNYFCQRFPSMSRASGTLKLTNCKGVAGQALQIACQAYAAMLGSGDGASIFATAGRLGLLAGLLTWPAKRCRARCGPWRSRGIIIEYFAAASAASRLPQPQPQPQRTKSNLNAPFPRAIFFNRIAFWGITWA